jgi:hypothetical protein
MVKQKAYYEMIDSLTVIHGVIGLCLDGTLGELNDQQKENLAMTERHVWQLYESIGILMGVKVKKTYKKLR